MTTHLISGVPITDLDSAVREMVKHAYDDLGLSGTSVLSDVDKQAVVGAVVDMGALNFRNAARDIAACLHVSKTTVYANIKRHLNLTRPRKRKA